MTFWLLLTVNSVTFGGLLFLLSAGFSLIFGLMRIPNLTHGSMFMAGAYLGATLLGGELGFALNFWLAAVVAALAVAAVSAVMERVLLRRLAGQQLAQVLVTLGVSFMVADLCLMGWGGDPISVATPAGLGGFVRVGPAVFPLYRMAVIAIAVVFAIALWLMLERTRLGAMIRAGVDDMQMARAVGIPVSRLLTIVFSLGAAQARAQTPAEFAQTAAYVAGHQNGDGGFAASPGQPSTLAAPLQVFQGKTLTLSANALSSPSITSA